MEYRKEHDTLGDILVPADHMWGAQTERSLENFRIGTGKMPHEIIMAFAILKKCAAKVNAELGVLDGEKAEVIEQVCDEILHGKWDDEFPLVIYQTGSGTQSNMNMNEVIAHIAGKKLKEEGSSKTVHPNDDVNRSQSSNDTYPTAMHIAAVLSLHTYLYRSMEDLISTLKGKSSSFMHVVKIGRTHLQDAVPLTLGQEISGWETMLEKTLEMIRDTEKHFLALALGGTAVGTGLNCPAGFDEKVAAAIAEETGYPFITAENKFYALTGKDSFVYSHGAVEAAAMDAMKIANDVRWLASGPRAGLGEITIPENEPGSSIMPGKVNPTQSEAVTMTACRIHGNQAVISFGASQGNFELNVFMPVIADAYIQSVRLLGDALHSFDIHCARGIQPCIPVIEDNVNKSLMLVTALSPHIGYEKAAAIAKKAHSENLSLKEAAMALGYVSEKEYDEFVDPERMACVK